METNEKQVKSYKNLAVEIGSTGTFEVDGTITDRHVPELNGTNGRRIYGLMRSDATVSAIIFAIEMMLRRSTWNCSPKDADDEKCVEYAEFFDSLRTDMSITWEVFLNNALSMLVYGWSFFEIVTKRRMGMSTAVPSKYDDGKWGIRKLAYRGQTTLDKWELDDNGNAVAFTQYIVGATKDTGKRTIPFHKGLLFRAGFWNDSPEGLSPLRGAYKPWLLLQGIDRAEAYGIERELNGLPVIRMPAEILQAAANGDEDASKVVAEYKQIVQDLRLNKQAGVILPSDVFANMDGTLTPQKQFELQLLSSNGSRSINVQTAAERHQVGIARCVLADFLMLGTTSRSGSQALGESRFEFFANALDGWNGSIAEVLNTYLIPRIAMLNGMDMDKLPRYMTESVNPISVETLVNCIDKYVRAGGTILPNPKVDEEVLNELGLPPMDPATRASIVFDPTLAPNAQNPTQAGQTRAPQQNNGNQSTSENTVSARRQN